MINQKFEKKHSSSIEKKTNKITGNGNDRGRGRTKLRRNIIVQTNMNLFVLTETIALDKREWRKRIYEDPD